MSEITDKQSEYTHKSVMIDEVCKYLDVDNRRNIVDMTLGLGGHSECILEKMAKTGKVIGFDADPSHIKLAKKRLKRFKDRVIYINSNFSNVTEELKKTRMRSFDGFLFDLGIASPHVDNPERGFSFLREGELDMRFDFKSQKTTAADVVNRYSEKELARIFKEFGEEGYAKKIAQVICKSRKRNPFKTTVQLADFIEKTVKRGGRIHPATRVFQALRIEVNKELDVLVEALTQAVSIVKSGGRIVVISYHSLEDRIVKNVFRDFSRGDEPVLKLIIKKPLVPTNAEISSNPRSRSAKMRVVEKL